MVAEQHQLLASAGYELKMHDQIRAPSVAAAMEGLEAVPTLPVKQRCLPLQPGGVMCWIDLQAQGAKGEKLPPAVAKPLVGGGTAVDKLEQVTVGDGHSGLAEQQGLSQQMELLPDSEQFPLAVPGGQGVG
jgi:hypothetical protein